MARTTFSGPVRSLRGFLGSGPETAHSLLAKTDWYVTRKAEDGTAIPTNVANYRAAVRTACANIETSIKNAANHAAFVALFNVPLDSNGKPTGNAPVHDWPDEL